MGADPAAPSTLGYVSPGAGQLTLRERDADRRLGEGRRLALGGGGAGMGGAIFSQGTVVIERSTLAENRAEGGSAGNEAAG